MNGTRACESLRTRLLDGGPGVIRDDRSAEEHLVGCPECMAFLEALVEVDGALAELPVEDASDELVAALLARPELQAPPGVPEPTRHAGRIRAWSRRASQLVLSMAAAGSAAGGQARRLIGRALDLLRPVPMTWRWAAAVVPALLVVAVLVMLDQDGVLQSTRSAPGAAERWAEVDAVSVEGELQDEALDQDKRKGADGTASANEEQRLEASATREESQVQGIVPQPALKAAAGPLGGKQRASEENKVGLVRQVPAEPATLGFADGAPRRDAAAPAPPTSATGDEALPAGRERLKEAVIDADALRTGTDKAQSKLEASPADTPTDSFGLDMLANEPSKDLEAAPVGPDTGSSRSGAVKLGGPEPEYPAEARAARVEGVVVLRCAVRPDGRVDEVTVLRGLPAGLSEAAVEAVRQWHFAPAMRGGRAVADEVVVAVPFRLDPGSSGAEQGPGSVAAAFLAGLEQLDDLEYQEPRGYWANTYVPGDRDLRALQARLMGWDRGAIEALAGRPLELHERAGAPARTFDPPRRAAVGLVLQADRTALEGPSRVRVQVGLRACEHQTGRRPQLSLAAVLDLRGPLDEATRAMIRATVESLTRAREPGDRFSLVVAGRPGGLVVPAGDFRHGPLLVALRELLDETTGTTSTTGTTRTAGTAEAGSGQGLGLVEAVELALRAVGDEASPGAPLGSSRVVLVTAQPVGSALEKLEGLAHRHAIEGTSLGVIGLGPAIRLDELERIALAGQGGRRLVSRPADAAGAVERELASAGRIVARALRLRIRLAPGVRLVDVVGSHRLDEGAAERVREAEASVDRRLAASLGIAADRGVDEDGIQIVIPGFEAGDSHVILLDLVAPGPGSVIDVSLRFKDLVWMRNGVAQARLTLGRGASERGPLELGVLKSLLAHHLSVALRRAGRLLGRGEVEAAIEVLDEHHRLLVGLPTELPGLRLDTDIALERALLEEYLAVLRAGVAADQTQRLRLSDSLRYAGRLQEMPAPHTTDLEATSTHQGGTSP